MTTLSDLLALKDLPRAGWKRVGIDHPESVAAHSWGMGCLAAVLAPPDLDLKQILLLCIAHDLPEILAGDITPHDGINRSQKQELEAQAAQNLLVDFPVLYEAWLEYERNESPEAQFVHAIDKLDMGLQAKRYSEIADTKEFIESAGSKLHRPLKDWL